MFKYKFLALLNFLVLLTHGKTANFPSSTVVGKCNSTQFQCTSGSCVKSQFRCDQNVDCRDGSDEVGCDRKNQNGLAVHGNSTNDNIGAVLNSTAPFSPTKVASTKKPRNRKLTTKTSNGTMLDVVEETLHLLEEGDKQIELREDHRDIVLVAGLTGAGKTTITKFITNPNDLEAYNAGERILIRDRRNGSISEGSTVVSKTIFPQLLIHSSKDSNTAFYDLPGFSDTRNATIEIANAFFMKKVAEHAEKIKILLVVSHKTLRNGGSRTEFKTLIEHLIRFVKDIGKFSQGVVLVASKVEDTRKSNDQIVRWIGEFLKGVDASLDQIFQDPEKIRHARTFLSALLEKDPETGKYKKIGIFRQPQVEGLLLDDPVFESNRNQVQDLILTRAQFVPTSPGDFGFSVSAEATLFTKSLAINAKKKAGLVIGELVQVIEEDLFEYPGNNSTSSESSLSTWTLLRKWTMEHSLFHQMTNALNEVVSCSTFFQILSDTLSVFSNPDIDQLTLELLKSEKQLGFFDVITLDFDPPPQVWINSFDKLEIKIGQKTKQLADQLNNHVMNITNALSHALKQQTLSLMFLATTNVTARAESGSAMSMPPQLDKQILFTNLTEDFDSVNRLISQILTTSTFAQFSTVTLSVCENTHLQVPSSILKSLRDLHFDMKFNSGINGQRFPFKINIWVKPIEVFAGVLQNQILTLSFHFSEETRRQNEARMNQQLGTLRNETRRAAEKAEEEARRLALEYQQREESWNGSLSNLQQELTNVRQQQKQEEEARKKQLEERERQFNQTLDKLWTDQEREREALRIQLEQGFNESLTKLRQDHEKEQEALKEELKNREQSFSGSLAEVRRQQEKERGAVKKQLEQQQAQFNQTLARLKKEHEERELRTKQIEEQLRERLRTTKPPKKTINPSWTHNYRSPYSNLVRGGQEGTDPWPTFICQASLPSQGTYPGKFVPDRSTCYISIGGSEISASGFKVLMRSDSHDYVWRRPYGNEQEIRELAVEGGWTTSGNKLYICRTTSVPVSKGFWSGYATLVGNVKEGGHHCVAPWMESSKAYSNYEILVAES